VHMLASFCRLLLSLFFFYGLLSLFSLDVFCIYDCCRLSYILGLWEGSDNIYVCSPLLPDIGLFVSFFFQVIGH
jgi:hypothetical protein